jgi:hypothetical protein
VNYFTYFPFEKLSAHELLPDLEESQSEESPMVALMGGGGNGGNMLQTSVEQARIMSGGIQN